VQPDGRILIGGDFTTVNGTTRNRIARLNTDGTLDTTFANGLTGANDDRPDHRRATRRTHPHRRRLHHRQRHHPQLRIARLNTDGTLDTTFANGLTGANNSVYWASPCNPTDASSSAANFTTVNGTTATASPASTPTAPSTPPSRVRRRRPTRRTHPHRRRFTTVNGTTRNRIARLDTDGTLDTTFAVDKAMFREAGANGFLGIDAPEEFGGGGQLGDFRFNVVMNEELQRAGVFGSGMCLTLHNDICMPYFLKTANDEQKAHWIPKLCSGEAMAAIAMTEPGIGSDLAGMSTTALKDGDHYVVNGSKTFITNGINSDVVITAVKTDPTQKHRGMSLLLIEEGMEGFTRGRNLSKIGLHAQDTAELFFTDVRVPKENLLGAEGQGFFQLVDKLPQERLSIAVTAVAHARAAFEWTCEYVRERKAFGQPIGAFQNTRFKLAEIKTEIDMAQAFVDAQVMALNAGDLTAEDAAESKWWTTEFEKRAIDQCLQLFGGYGYMEEYPIARAYRDARIQSIYGGTTEIMKEIIGRSLQLA
jgi:uncharacterized delta-60 repeat protein